MNKNESFILFIIVFLIINSCLYAIFCPECGKENTDDAKFCINCGKKLPTNTEEESKEDTLQKQIREMREKGISEETIQLFIESQKIDVKKKNDMEKIHINISFYNDEKDLKTNAKYGIRLNCNLDGKSIFDKFIEQKKINEIDIEINKDDMIHILDINVTAIKEKSHYREKRSYTTKHNIAVRKKYEFKTGSEKYCNIDVKFTNTATLLKSGVYVIEVTSGGLYTDFSAVNKHFNELARNSQLLLLIKNFKKHNERKYMYPVLELHMNEIYVYFTNSNLDIGIPLNDIQNVRTESSLILGIGIYHNLIITVTSGDEYLFNRFPTKIAKELAQIINDKL